MVSAASLHLMITAPFILLIATKGRSILPTVIGLTGAVLGIAPYWNGALMIIGVIGTPDDLVTKDKSTPTEASALAVNLAVIGAAMVIHLGAVAYLVNSVKLVAL